VPFFAGLRAAAKVFEIALYFMIAIAFVGLLAALLSVPRE